MPAWAAVTLLRHRVPEAETVPLGVLTTLYIGVLSMLIGSLASAEERQFGTLETQIMLPMEAWRQWAVKAGVAMGLALLLAAGLLMLLWSVNPPDVRLDPLPLWPAAVGVLLVTASSLYVSTMSIGGVKAMVWSLPFLLALVIWIRSVEWGWWVIVNSLRGVLPPAFVDWGVHRSIVRALPSLTAGAIVIALLRAGLLNHRSADRSPTRVVRQLLSIAVFVTVVTLLTAIVVGLIALLRR